MTMTGTGLRPDAALIVKMGDKTALLFFEIDCATERLTSPASYSLLGKLRSYAEYFDSRTYVKDFSWAGVIHGFRVGVILTSPTRLTNLRRILEAEGLDFIILSTIDEIIKNGLYGPIWRSHQGLVDLFGRGAHA